MINDECQVMSETGWVTHHLHSLRFILYHQPSTTLQGGNEFKNCLP